MQLHLSRATIARNIKSLVVKGLIKRIGADKVDTGKLGNSMNNKNRTKNFMIIAIIPKLCLSLKMERLAI